MIPHYKILIVEDEFIIATQLKILLEAEGYEVINIVDNYIDAVNTINSTQPDLIIADIRLGDDIDGGIRISKYVSIHYNIPVIFLSGYSDKETITKAKETNPNTFLIKPKPLDKIQLLATIQIALPNSAFNSKLKSIALKGKEIEILESYEFMKEHDRLENITRFFCTNDIAFIETYNHHFKNTIIIRFVHNSKGFLVREDMEEIQKKLPDNFVRIHKSYLVNLKNITGHKLPHYLLFKNIQIPIGDKHRHRLHSYFENIG